MTSEMLTWEIYSEFQEQALKDGFKNMADDISFYVRVMRT